MTHEEFEALKQIPEDWARIEVLKEQVAQQRARAEKAESHIKAVMKTCNKVIARSTVASREIFLAQDIRHELMKDYHDF